MHRNRRFLFLLPVFCLGVFVLSAGQQVQPVQQVTANNVADRLDGTSQGKILWRAPDPNDANIEIVFFWDGTTPITIREVQRDDPNDPSLDKIDTVLPTVGSGATPGQVVAAWRRGTDFPWIWVSDDANSPKLANIVNAINANQGVNPEDPVAIDSGCMFWEIQPAGNAGTKIVYQIDPVLNTTEPLSLVQADVAASQPTSSGCQAAWHFDDFAGNIQLEFWDGTNVRVLDTGQSRTFGTDPRLRQGRVVYVKQDANGIFQIFLVDTTLPGPLTPVQLTHTTDPTKGNFFPQTDGLNVAWRHGDLNIFGTGPGPDLEVIFNGEPLPNVVAFALDRGQLAWTDENGALHYDDGSGPITVDITPASTVSSFDLRDGFIAFSGVGGSDGGNDTEIFLFTGTTPLPFADQPNPPPIGVNATPGDSQVTVEWAHTSDSASFNLYFATESGITKANFSTLSGGTKVSDVTSPFTVTGLLNHVTYFFVVTVIVGGIEGPESQEVSATPAPPLPTWAPVGNLSTFSFFSAAADPTDPLLAYAGGGGTGFDCMDADKVAGCDIYKTTDGGQTWSVVTGSVNRIDIRALAASSQGTVFAASPGKDIPNIPSKILRSTDGGATWSAVLETPDIGELNKSLAIDPLTPTTIYAGDFGGFTDPGFIVKSTDGGATWVHLPSSAGGFEIRAYDLAIDPVNSGTLYAGGTGTPNLAKSTDGGQTWTSVEPAGGLVYSVALNPATPTTIYVGMDGFSGPSLGVFKSTDGGTTWTTVNTGIPTPLSRINDLLVDPASPNTVYAATEGAGIFRTTDGGNNWTTFSEGLTAQGVNALALTPSRRLLSATSAGLFLFDLSRADLFLTKTASPSQVSSGQNLTYTLTVSNAGPEAATGVTLGDTLPAGVTLVSATPSQGTCSGTSTITCTLGTIASGASVSVDIVVTTTVSGQLTNLASVSSEQLDPDTVNNVATVVSDVAAPSFTLTVNKAGTGSGTVTSSPAGINCGTDCSESYTEGTVVTLTATPEGNSVFTGWTGCDGVSGNTCAVTVSANKTVTATFDLPNPVPSLTSLTPSSVIAGASGFPLTVTGSNFVSDSVVRWNGSDRTTTFVSSTELTATVLATDIAAAGTADVTVFNLTPGGGTSFALTFTINPPPVVNMGGTVNGASFSSQPPAASSIGSLFGTGLGSATDFASAVPLPTTLAGARVQLNGIEAPLFFVSPLQINFQFPNELQGLLEASISVTLEGVTSNVETIPLAPFGPGLFATNQAGSGQGAILISGTGGAVAAPTGTFPGSRPVMAGEFIEIFCTGLGAVTNQPATGAAASSSPLSETTTTPTVTIGGVAANVTFSGLAPGFVGLYQVNVEVPANAPTGDAVDVVLTIDGVTSNTVTIAVQ